MDEDTLQAAIMMKFINIYALVQGIQESNDLACLALFNKEDIASLSKTRNIALHECERLNYNLIKIAIEKHLPPIKERIDKFLSVNITKDKSTEQSVQSQDSNSSKAILSRLGNAYSKKVDSGAIKTADKNSKERER